MIKMILCDDDPHMLSRIKEYILSERSELEYEFYIETCPGADGVLEKLRQESYDILVTDIDMPQMSGMELAGILRKENDVLLIIFMTAYSEYVYRSFEYAPFRYIRKEFMETELLPALQAAGRKIIMERGGTLAVRTPGGVELLQTQDILYYELENRKCIIYTVRGTYETWKNISQMREELGTEDEAFIQIYRGCMVNKHYVKSIRSRSVILENGTELPISRRKNKEISDAMMEYWASVF